MVVFMFIAHRGLHTHTVENSIPSFLAAINNPDYAGFELDIYTSKDNIFVVHHDPLIDGKLITHYNYKDLKNKGIIKLEEVLKLPTDKIILIEIKDINIDIAKLRKLLNKYQDKKLYVMSFFNSVIKKFSHETFKFGVLNYILNSTSNYHGDFIGILYDVATPHLISSLRNLNLEVFLYALNKKDKYLYSNVYYIVDEI